MRKNNIESIKYQKDSPVFQLYKFLFTEVSITALLLVYAFTCIMYPLEMIQK